jgi:hypothetical protein
MAITEIKLSGKVYTDAGTAVSGATVALLETGTSSEETSTTTNSSGEWSFAETDLNTTYDIKITVGSSVRYILWSDEITTTGLDTASLKVRGVASAAAPIYLFADRADDAGDGWRIQASTSDTLAIGSDKASAGTIIDYLTITNGATAAASVVALGGDLTVGDDLSLTSDSAVLNMGAGSDFTITHDGTTGATIAGNPLTLDSGADIVLDAEGADVILKDGGTQYGALTNSSSNLIIKSGSTTAATFSGANVTLAGTVGSGAITSTSTIQGTTITATTAFVPDASDGAALGTTSLEFSDLYLADGAVVGFGDDQEVTLTHVHNTGLLLSSTDKLQFGDSGTFIHQSADGVLTIESDTTVDINGAVALNGAVTGATDITLSGELDAATLDISGNADIDGTANLDEVVIDGVVQINATLTSGVDGQGYDTKFFGDTASAYILWDTSADKLLTAGGAVIDIVKDKLLIGGTAVTTTAAELNILDGVTSTAAELNLVDGSSADTVVNSKAVIYGSSGELAGTLSTVAQGNVTSVGTLTALTVDNVAINGTTIGHTGDTDLITLASGTMTLAGTIDMGNNGILNVGAAGNDWTTNLLKLSNANAGGLNGVGVQNTSTAADSSARFELQVGHVDAGDPYIDFDISGGQRCVMGLDNSNNDLFVISDSAGIGQNDRFRLDVSTGVLSVSGDGGGSDDPVLLFDDYDDAALAKTFAYAHPVAPDMGLVTQEQWQANRELLVELGIAGWAVQESGPDHLMYRLQPMLRMLAGGIYQNRAMMDELRSEIRALSGR